MAKRRAGQPKAKGGHLVRPLDNPLVESPDQRPPVFCLRHMRRGWSLAECNKDEKAAFADTLHLLSQLTWAGIRAAPRHGHGSEVIARASIKGDSIPKHVPEEAHLLALRFYKMAPMVGYRGVDGVVFHVVWLDRTFTLYDHG